MRPSRIAAALIAAAAAAAAAAHGASAATSQRVVCVNGHCVVETGGGGEVHGTSGGRQSSSSTVVQTSGGGSAGSAVTIIQSGAAGSVASQAVATTPPGPSLTVRLPASRMARLLARRAPLLEVSADRAVAVKLTATVLWRPRPGRRERIVLVRRELAVDGTKPRRLRLGASARGLARLPERGGLTLRVTARAPEGATVALQLRA